MEKQPVDDLFARKLRENGVHVNPDTFARLQQRMGAKKAPQKKIYPVWRYAVAACFLGVLAVGHVLSTNDAVTTSGLNQVVRHEEKGSRKPTRISETEGLVTRPIGKDTDNEKIVSHLPETRYVALNRPKNTDKRTTVRMVQKLLNEQSKQLANTERVDQLRLKPDSPALAIPGQLVQVTPIQRSTTDRTVILSIGEPQTVADQTDKSNSVSADGARPHGFSGLLGKLRQLKNGETFARATTSSDKGTTPFRRTLAEVKESFKNETTIDQ